MPNFDDRNGVSVQLDPYEAWPLMNQTASLAIDLEEICLS
jgi:hypothetical protein